MTTQKYGWRPSLPDHRNYKFIDRKQLRIDLPPEIDLRKSPEYAAKLSPIKDQGNLGACTGFGCSAIFRMTKLKQYSDAANRADLVIPEYSELFTYYNGRLLEGTTAIDAGATIRDVMRGINKYGIAKEELWPYVISKFKNRPIISAYKSGSKNQSIKYYELNNQNLIELKSCIGEGFPFVFGISVYDSFESQSVAQSGIVPLPQQDEKLLGGHCMAAFGYDDAMNAFLVRNSWGLNWGDAGYCWLPYKYLINPSLAGDFWTIRTTE